MQLFFGIQEGLIPRFSEDTKLHRCWSPVYKMGQTVVMYSSQILRKLRQEVGVNPGVQRQPGQNGMRLSYRVADGIFSRSLSTPGTGQYLMSVLKWGKVGSSGRSFFLRENQNSSTHACTRHSTDSELWASPPVLSHI